MTTAAIAHAWLSSCIASAIPMSFDVSGIFGVWCQSQRASVASLELAASSRLIFVYVLKKTSLGLAAQFDCGVECVWRHCLWLLLSLTVAPLWLLALSVWRVLELEWLLLAPLLSCCAPRSSATWRHHVSDMQIYVVKKCTCSILKDVCNCPQWRCLMGLCGETVFEWELI